VTLDILNDDGQIQQPTARRTRAKKSRAQFKRESHALFEPAAATEGSWWIGLSRQAFYAKAAERFPEIKTEPRL
jgi:hypothetical protein